MNTLRPTTANRQRGFTLIEVLVAVLVLAIGLLGLAGLQVSATRNNHNAYLRSQATILAYDIIDRMQANRQAALNGDYNVAYGAHPNQNCTGGGGCSATQLANADLDTWKDDINNTLPGNAGGQITSRNAPVGDTIFTIAVRWDESGQWEENAGGPQQITLQFETQL